MPAGAHDVVDLAAGTGALTALLVDRVTTVTAVEPDPDMRAVLVRTAPSAEVIAGTAEAIPLPDACADAVFVSSAWHWFEPEAAVPEIARVLRDRGRLGVLRNGLDARVDWIAALRERPGQTEGEGRRPRHQVVLPAGSPFAEPQEREVSWFSPMTVEDLLNLLETYSQMIISSPEDRQRARVAARAVLTDHPDTRGLDVIDVPMRSWGWRSDRLARG